MKFWVIDRNDVALLTTFDKDEAVAFKRRTKEAVNILYQTDPKGEQYLLRENHPYEETV